MVTETNTKWFECYHARFSEKMLCFLKTENKSFLMILLKNLFASLLIFSSWNYLFHFTTIGWLFFFLFHFSFSSVWWYKFRTRWTIFDQDDKKFLYFSTSKLSEFFINVVFLTWWFFTISRLGLTLFSADKFLYLPDINKNILKFSFSLSQKMWWSTGGYSSFLSVRSKKFLMWERQYHALPFWKVFFENTTNLG